MNSNKQISYENYALKSMMSQKQNWTLQSLSHEFTSRQVILQHTYWLTSRHIGDFCDVPLTQVSIEGGISWKHYREKKKADYILPDPNLSSVVISTKISAANRKNSHTDISQGIEKHENLLASLMISLQLQKHDIS
jgi:hypothetical protein